MSVGSKLLYELYNCKSPQQDADDRDEELDPEESLGKTNSVLKILMQKVGQEFGIPSVIINHRLWDERGSLFRDKNLPRDENAFRPPFCLAFFIQPHSPLIQTAHEQDQFFSLKQMSPSKGSIFCHGKYTRAWYLQKLICYRNITTVQRKYWQKSQRATETLPAIQSSLGPGLAVGGKGKKRGQIGKILASEASWVYSGEGEWAAEPGVMPLMPPFHDVRFWYLALIGQMSSCWQIRGAVDSIALFQYHAPTIREKIF